MDRVVQVVIMDQEEYMEKHGEEYDKGELWDYPLEELEHIIVDTDINKVALIDDRLFELPN